MFITFNTKKQAFNFIKRRIKEQKPVVEYMVGADIPIYKIDIDDKNKIIEIIGWICGCGCGKASASATILGKLKM